MTLLTRIEKALEVEKAEVIVQRNSSRTDTNFCVANGKVILLEKVIGILRQEFAKPPTDEEVARVAVAICPWFNGSKDSQPQQAIWEDMFERYKQAYRDQARAAIAADRGDGR